jgi:hypothetical protein
MGRKPGFDGKKVSAIISALARSPDGLWLRQLSKELYLSPATVSKYLDGILSSMVEESRLGDGRKPLLRVIKLKPFVLEKIHEGRSISEILKLLKIFNKLERDE